MTTLTPDLEELMRVLVVKQQTRTLTEDEIDRLTELENLLQGILGQRAARIRREQKIKLVLADD